MSPDLRLEMKVSNIFMILIKSEESTLMTSPYVLMTVVGFGSVLITVLMTPFQLPLYLVTP